MTDLSSILLDLVWSGNAYAAEVVVPNPPENASSASSVDASIRDLPRPEVAFLLISRRHSP
jgi:hypothetical protein